MLSWGQVKESKIVVFHRNEQNIDFKKLNKIECTTFKTIISILNSLTYALGVHVSICLIYNIQCLELTQKKVSNTTKKRYYCLIKYTSDYYLKKIVRYLIVFFNYF